MPASLLIPNSASKSQESLIMYCVAYVEAAPANVGFAISALKKDHFWSIY
jgi:hypothetical protein